MTVGESIEAEVREALQHFVGERNTPETRDNVVTVLEPVVDYICQRFEIGPEGVRRV